MRPAHWLGLLALGALGAVWACQPISHDDVFWHIRTGESIAQDLRVPLTDSFSFTRLGQRWITHEWGFSLLTGLTHRLGGLQGSLWLTVLVVWTIGFFVWRRCPRREPGARTWALLATGLGLLAVEGLVFLRPALVGEALFALTLWTTDRYREGGRTGWLAATIAVFWLWANIHSGVIFGIFVLGLQAFEQLLAGRWRLPASPLPKWALAAATAVTAAVSVVNPNGLDALRFPFLLSRIFFGSGIDWDLGQFTPQSPFGNLALMGLALALVIGMVKCPSRSWPRPWELVAIATFLLLSLRASRFEFSLVVLLVPPAARLLASIAATRPALHSSRMAWLVSALLATVSTAEIAATPLRWPLRTLDRSLPVGAAKFIAGHGLRGHMFHHANHGGYLYYALGQPIFWDGRNDVFWTLTREVTTTDFSVVAPRYDVDILVLTEREYRDLHEEAESGRWGLVYWDDSAAVYLRRDRFGPALKTLELGYFRGFGGGGTEELRALATDLSASRAARDELRGLLAVWPENQRALYFLGVIAHYSGDHEEAVAALRRAIDQGSSELLENTLAVIEPANR